MTEHKPLMRALRALRAGPLRGEFSPPGDRGFAARAMMLASLAVGESRIAGFGETRENDLLIAALRTLGAHIEVADGIARIEGVGTGGYLAPEADLQFGTHAGTVTLGMGLVGLYAFESRIGGAPALAARDFTPELAPLRLLGARVVANESRFLPVTLRGPRTPVALEIHLHHDSPDIKGSVLLAALNCPGLMTIVEPNPTHTATEALLGRFSVKVVARDLPGGIRETEMAGLQDLTAADITVPGSLACAYYPILAALLIPGSSLLLHDVLAMPSRMGLLLTLIEMGADITLINRRAAEGFEFVDIRVRHSTLSGIEVPAERVAALVEDYHLITLAAAFATGTTTMPGLAEPEGRDRLTELAHAITAAGGSATRSADRLVVEGGGRLRGGVDLKARRDPALTLIYLIMGMAARDPVAIEDDSAAGIAYPGFVALFEGLGVRFTRIG